MFDWFLQRAFVGHFYKVCAKLQGELKSWRVVILVPQVITHTIFYETQVEYVYIFVIINLILFWLQKYCSAHNSY